MRTFKKLDTNQDDASDHFVSAKRLHTWPSSRSTVNRSTARGTVQKRHSILKASNQSESACCNLTSVEVSSHRVLSPALIGRSDPLFLARPWPLISRDLPPELAFFGPCSSGASAALLLLLARAFSAAPPSSSSSSCLSLSLILISVRFLLMLLILILWSHRHVVNKMLPVDCGEAVLWLPP